MDTIYEHDCFYLQMHNLNFSLESFIKQIKSAM